MFFDLNFPVFSPPAQGSKKAKGKQPAAEFTHTLAQISAIEARLDLVVRLGYTVIGFNQTVLKKVEQKTHVNVLDGLIPRLRKRDGVLFLKRLTIVLDEESEKGFGLTSANSGAIFERYDLIGLMPTTQSTFASACLTHSLPSPLTAHIIVLPLRMHRLPFQMKRTLVKSAIRNGAVFELAYAGALGGELDPELLSAGIGEGGIGGKRNWWVGARDVVRVAGGSGFVVAGGVLDAMDYRAPRDIENLMTLLGVAQDAAHAALTKGPRSVMLRAETRKTYRAVLSQPKIIVVDQDLTLPGQELVDVESANAPPIQKRAREVEDGDTVEAGHGVIEKGTSNRRKKKTKKARGGELMSVLS